MVGGNCNGLMAVWYAIKNRFLFSIFRGLFWRKRRLLLLYFRCFAKLPFSCPGYQRFLKLSKVVDFDVQNKIFPFSTHQNTTPKRDTNWICECASLDEKLVFSAFVDYLRLSKKFVVFSYFQTVIRNTPCESPFKEDRGLLCFFLKLPWNTIINLRFGVCSTWA